MSGNAKGVPPATSTCECLHAGMWHRPNCRIRGCDCQQFVHSVIRASESADESWVQRGKLTRKRPTGKGPQE